jgi:hypothetical protein
MQKTYSENNIELLYVREFQIRGFLHNIESSYAYLMQYANHNLFENEKKTQLVEMFLEKYPYVHPNLNNEKIMLICEKI